MVHFPQTIPHLHRVESNITYGDAGDTEYDRPIREVFDRLAPAVELEVLAVGCHDIQSQTFEEVLRNSMVWHSNG